MQEDNIQERYYQVEVIEYKYCFCYSTEHAIE